MPENSLVVNVEGSETRVGLLEDGVLVEYFIERARERGLSGNLYKGRISRVLPGMQAAFVDLGPTVERKAYLYVAEILGAGDEARLFAGYDSGDDGEGKKTQKSAKARKRAAASRRIEELVSEGQEILVQIVKEPVGDKGARVTGYLSLPGRHCVFMPTVDRVGVSRRIASDKERRRLRELVDSVRPKGAGFVVRTAAEGAPDEEVRDDVRFLVNLWDELRRREKATRAPNLLYAELDLALRVIRDLLRPDTKELAIDDEDAYRRAVKFTQAFMPSYVDRIKLYAGRRPIFDHYNVEEQLRNALYRHVPLKSGGHLVIEQGEALTAIDVNTGSFVGEADLETTITKNNIEACHEVAHQLRLRNIGGIIVIDFVDMDKPQNRKLVWEEFNKALGKDSVRANVTKISELGLVEMTRKRTRESLKQLLTDPCPACEGRSYVKSTIAVASEILREIRRQGSSVPADRIEIVCAPKVAELLERYERDYLDGLEKRFHKKVEIKASGSMAPDRYKVAGKAVVDAEPTKKRSASGGGRRRKRSGNAAGGSRGKKEAEAGASKEAAEQ